MSQQLRLNLEATANKLTVPIEQNNAIKRAILQVDLLPGFKVMDVVHCEKGGSKVRISVSRLLPSKWAKIGKSPSGVHSTEIVDLVFSADYPDSAPKVHLRPDFPEQPFHYTSAIEGLGPSPCLTAEPLKDFFLSQGLGAVLGQLQDWLKKAAHNKLINEEDGYEPNPIVDARFIVLGGGTSLECDPVTKSTVCNYHESEITNRNNNSEIFNLGINGLTDPKQVAKAAVERISLHFPFREDINPVLSIIDTKNITSLEGLFSLLELAGIDQSVFEASIVNVLHHKVGEAWNQTGPQSLRLPIVLDVKRPYRVTGTSSPAEHFYFCLIWPRRFGLEYMGSDPRRIPCVAGVTYGISDPAIRQRLSGLSESREFTLAGAGSLGSNIGSSLVRAGWTCSTVADPDLCLPHNQARHSLFWDCDDYPSKRDAMAMCLSSLGSPPIPIANILNLDPKSEDVQDDFLINTTASPVVLETLIDRQSQRESTRLIDTELYLGGEVGVVLCEGPTGNPSCLDLKAAAFLRMGYIPNVGSHMLGAGKTHEHVLVGGGCGTTTMIMSNAQLDATAGQITKEVLHWGEKFKTTSFQKAGHGCLFAPAPNGRGTVRQGFSLTPFTVVNCSNAPWTIRIDPELADLFQKAMIAAGDCETGGYLIGHVNERRQEITIVDSIPPPPDSTATSVHLTLGIQGVKMKMSSIFERTGGYLLDVGTWHTHLSESPPSPEDKRLVEELARNPDRSLPSVMLVRTPTTYHAILADPVLEDNT